MGARSVNTVYKLYLPLLATQSYWAEETAVVDFAKDAMKSYIDCKQDLISEENYPPSRIRALAAPRCSKKNATCQNSPPASGIFILCRNENYTLHVAPAPLTPEWAWIECGRSTPCRRGEALSRLLGTRLGRRTLRGRRLGGTAVRPCPTRILPCNDTHRGQVPGYCWRRN